MIIFPLDSKFSLNCNLATIFNENGSPDYGTRVTAISETLPIPEANLVNASSEIGIHVPVVRHVLQRYQITCVATAVPNSPCIVLCSFYILLQGNTTFHCNQDKGEYRSIYPRTNTQKFSIIYQGPMIWNNLPEFMRSAFHIVNI